MFRGTNGTFTLLNPINVFESLFRAPEGQRVFMTREQKAVCSFVDISYPEKSSLPLIIRNKGQNGTCQLDFYVRAVI